MKFSAVIATVATLVAATSATPLYANIYSRCGGIGWTGPTQCVPGTTCHYFNDYYSQCY
ncbi:hypothetical protein DRE_00297 [Drechslerella stenobrocha 248]|uniref:CBM1 domain-containing protein n=1 Tax=Drechslerella stenobrocha 248 TaxID=1043628 RepID=W7HUX4_9PEZI|nr:hypothetical protein DRE_00297 [Drechslerella stenobrocha 248]